MPWNISKINVQKQKRGLQIFSKIDDKGGQIKKGNMTSKENKCLSDVQICW